MKKKILILIPSIVIGGGAGKVAASLSEILIERYNIYILTFYDFENLYSYKGNYISLGLSLKTWKKILLPFKVFKLIRKISPDIIISFMDHTNTLSIFIKLLFHIRIPLMICNHSNLKMAYRDKKKYMNYLIRYLYRLNVVNRIITISKEMHNFLENDYKIRKQKIITIHNGINIQEIKELSKHPIKHRDFFEKIEIIKFISVGRLVDLKGYKYLIKAFSKVKKDVSNSKLFIIGDGPLRLKYENMIKQKKLEKDIILLGLIKNPYKYLSKSNIFVLSSKYETFPMVLLEALACGLPIISTNCHTGPKEILKNGQYGILAKVMDSDDLAEKMTFLAKNYDLIKNYSEKSLERAKKYDINKISEKWVNLINSYIR